MKPNALLIVATILTLCFTVSCGKRFPVVPEISSSLLDEEILEFKNGLMPLPGLISNKGELLFITNDGKIRRLTPKTKMINFLYSLSSPLDMFFMQGENNLLLRKKNSRDYIVFDMEKMKETHIIKNLHAGKILGIFDQYICLRRGNRLIFFHYPTAKITASLGPAPRPIDESKKSKSKSSKKAEETQKKPQKLTVKNKKVLLRDLVFNRHQFFNAQAVTVEDRKYVLAMASNTLFIFDMASKTMSRVALKHRATSGFLAEGNHIYYGSKSRDLLKVSWPKGKVKWKFKLGDVLTVTPQKAGRYIATLPEDNNLQFFTKGGTLDWWSPLESSRKIPPMIMKENAVVFLKNRKIKFFDFKKKTTTMFVLGKVSYGIPAGIGEDVYIITLADAGENKKPLPQLIKKIGNNMGLVITTQPEGFAPVGKSVKFDFTNINLTKPSLDIKIFNPANKVVFQKQIQQRYQDEEVSFVWTPDKEDIYRLAVTVNSENLKELKMEEIITAIDMDRKMRKYYHKALRKGITDGVILKPHRKKEKSQEK